MDFGLCGRHDHAPACRLLTGQDSPDSGWLVDVDRDHPLTKVTVPAHHVFTSRVMLAFASVATGLTATLHTRALIDDLDGLAEPITEMGILHHKWINERRLPTGLGHH